MSSFSCSLDSGTWGKASAIARGRESNFWFICAPVVEGAIVGEERDRAWKLGEEEDDEGRLRIGSKSLLCGAVVGCSG